MVQTKSIQQILRDRGYSPPQDDTYNYISAWLAWYQGCVDDFHRYDVYNGIQKVRCRRYTLGMAKKICEDWANLLLNEKVEIVAGNKKQTEEIQAILHENNFRVRANQLIEISFALGTGAFIEYKDLSGRVIIEYVRADMIFPLSWDNGEVTECAFGSYKVIEGSECIYIQIYRKGRGDEEDTKRYYIENVYYYLDGTVYDRAGSTQAVVSTGTDQPLFQLIRPNIYNNIDLESPMGVSIYANALDQLKGCDLVYDSYLNEFLLGKKRIIVPATMARIDMGNDGAMRPIFDPNDTVFYALPDGNRGDVTQKISENNMEIRSQAHEMGLQRVLDSLSLKCGMGNNRYKYDSGGVKTATEVISEKSDLYQNLRKNELILETALKNLILASSKLSGIQLDPKKISINFDDSIITDRQSEMKQDLQLVTAGIMQKWEFRVKYFGETEQEARKAVETPEMSLFEGEE